MKRHRFNLELLADDVQVEKKDRTINEPIFFYVSGSKRPYELVVNEVKPNQVKGYLSTPKGATEVAARSDEWRLSESEGRPGHQRGSRVSTPTGSAKRNGII